MRFKLQNRYQDSDWEDLYIEAQHLVFAEEIAIHLAKQSMTFGMTRIIDTDKKLVVKTYAAGSAQELKK